MQLDPPDPQLLADLAALRGFSESDCEAPPSSDLRVLTDPIAGTFGRPEVEVTERWFREMVQCEAEAVVRIVAMSDGEARWTELCESYRTSNRRGPSAEASQIAFLGRRLEAKGASQSAMAGALGNMKPPVLRRHRSAFLRHVKQHGASFPADAREAFDRTAAIRIKLLRAYVPLVYWVARRYPYGLHGLALRRAGVAGLIDALDGFEPERGNRFLTYARWWVLARIARIGGTSRPVHRPGHLGERVMRLGRAREDHWRQHGRAPGWEELMSAVRGDSSEVSWMRTAVCARRFDHPLHAAHPDGGTLLDHLVEVDPPDADRDEQLAKLWRLYHEVEEDLDDRRAAVLRARFGLVGKPRRTLSEIGDELGLSRERVRQLERDALVILAQRWRAPSG